MINYHIEPIYKLIGQKIRVAREELKLCQAELAQKINVSTSAITHYENATRRIPVHHLKKLEQTLGKPHEYFVNEKNFSNFYSIRDKLIAFANSISDSIYLPVSDYATFNINKSDEYDPYELKNKTLYPFPPEIAEDVDFVLRYKDDKQVIYCLLNTKIQPEADDLVCLIHFPSTTTYKECKTFHLRYYGKILEEEKKYKEMDLDYDEKEKIVGVVKAVILKGNWDVNVFKVKTLS